MPSGVILCSIIRWTVAILMAHCSATIQHKMNHLFFKSLTKNIVILKVHYLQGMADKNELIENEELPEEAVFDEDIVLEEEKPQSSTDSETNTNRSVSTNKDLSTYRDDQ